MESLIIVGVLMICIIGPMIIFSVIGYKSIEELSRRPNLGGRVMIPLILKLTITAAIMIGLLMGILEVFG